MKLRFLISILVVFTFGCTRGQNSDTNSLTIRAPQKATLSGTLTNLIVNIRNGSGEIVRKYAWSVFGSCDAPAGSPCPVPQAFVIDNLPSGAGNLIQVLGVYQGATGAQEFKYGDDVKDFNGGVVETSINLTTISTGSGKEARFGGRILTGNNIGPTGDVAIGFKPPGEKPEMEIMDSIILNGWFQFFAVEGAPFIYTLKSTGQKLFENIDLQNVSQPELLTKPYRIRLNVPTYFREIEGTNQQEQGGSIIIGYYGPYVDSNESDFVLCYDDVNDDPYPYVYEDVGETPLLWDGISPFTDPSVHPVGTGGSAPVGSCIAGPEPFKMVFNYEHFDGWMGSFFGFEGAYKVQQIETDRFSPMRFVSGSITGSRVDLGVQFDYLPSVRPAAVTSTTSFVVKKSVLEQNSASDLYDCQALFNSSAPFSGVSNQPSVTRFEPSTENNSTGTTQVTMPKSWLDNDSAEIVICPWKSVSGARSYYFAGIRSHGVDFNFPTHKLELKLVGEGIGAIDDMYPKVKPLGTNDYSFLNFNLAHPTSPVFLIGVAQPLQSGHDPLYPIVSDISLLEVSFDNGVSWTDVYSSCAGAFDEPSNSSGQNIARLDINQLSGCGAVSGSWATGIADATIKFRMTIDPSAADGLLGLGNGIGNVVESGNLTLKADTACPSHTFALVRSSNVNAHLGATFMDAFLMSNAVNDGTDVSVEYQKVLVSAGSTCVDTANGNRTLSTVIRDFGIISPPSCFGDWDINVKDVMNPFSFKIDPIDKEGADCDLSGMSLNVNVAGEGTATGRAFGAGDIIQHSDVPAHLMPYMSADTGVTILGDNIFRFLESYVPQGLDIGILSAYGNSDFQPTDRSSGAGLPASVNYSNSQSFTLGGVTGNPSEKTTRLPANPLLEVVNFDNTAGVTGSFRVSVHNLTEDVIYVDAKPFRDGSPLILTRSGSDRNVYYIPNPGAPLKKLIGPITMSGNADSVTHYYDGNFDVVIMASGDELHYFAIGYQDDNLMSSSSRVLLATKSVIDYEVLFDGSQEFVLAVTEEGFNDGHLYYLPFSTYDGTNWNHPTPPSDLTVNEAGEILDCDGAWYLVGIWNANYAAIIPFGISPGAVTGNATNHTLGGDGSSFFFGEYNQFDCGNDIAGEKQFYAIRKHSTAQMPSAGRVPLIFKGYSEGGQIPFTEILFTDATRYVDAMKALPPSPITGGVARLLMVERSTNTSNPVEINLYTPAQGGTTYTFDKTIATLPNSATDFLEGVQVVNENGSEIIYLYGVRGQLYRLTAP